MRGSQGAFAVTTNKEGKLLLVQLTERFDKAWNFPGGVVEPGEDPKDAAARETLEETGVKCEIIEKIDELDTPDLFLNFYSAKYLSGKIKLQLTEVINAGWFSKDQALKLKLAFDVKERIGRYL